MHLGAASPTVHGVSILHGPAPVWMKQSDKLRYDICGACLRNCIDTIIFTLKSLFFLAWRFYLCHFDVCVKESSPVGNMSICVSVPHKAQEGAGNR